MMAFSSDQLPLVICKYAYYCYGNNFGASCQSKSTGQAVAGLGHKSTTLGKPVHADSGDSA